MRLVSWNVHAFRDAAFRWVGEDVVAALADCGADVVALQEIDSLTRPGRERLPLDALLERYPHQQVTYTIESRLRRYGHALLSRHPLARREVHDVTGRGFEVRRVLDASLATAAGADALRVLSTHLDLAPWARRAQLRALAALARGRPTPTVVVGDLNVLRAGAVQRGVGDALHLLASPPTFPASRPWLALDRVLCRPRGLVKSVRLAELPHRLSDHCALEIEL
jgi:endonuclease/exonuclease/phosphatase family metal-dependent hydrolase